jgi:hypothetical protein
MRVLVDANVFIRYLLTPQRSSPSAAIVRAAILGDFTLLLPEALMQELVARASAKPYLAQRIQAADLAELAGILESVAEIVPRITQPIPAVTRDPKDDYLIAHALVGRADYLVTGDADLLALDEVGGTKIVTPRAFVAR